MQFMGKPSRRDLERHLGADDPPLGCEFFALAKNDSPVRAISFVDDVLAQFSPPLARTKNLRDADALSQPLGAMCQRSLRAATGCLAFLKRQTKKYVYTHRA